MKFYQCKIKFFGVIVLGMQKFTVVTVHMQNMQRLTIVTVHMQVMQRLTIVTNY